jgi:hypothetical protein
MDAIWSGDRNYSLLRLVSPTSVAHVVAHPLLIEESTVIVSVTAPLSLRAGYLKLPRVT